MNWLKSIELMDAITIDKKVLRCAYCGRRVSSDEICPGCGSDITTLELY